MATFQNFRTSFSGFNREDVVHYIEYINNKHASQVNQLKNDLQAARAELKELEAKAAAQQDQSAELQEALQAKEAAEAELEALRQELDSLRNAQPAQADPTFYELEAYRRAERAERIAGERVSQMYQQANGALSEAALKADEVSLRITEITDRIATDVAELKTTLGQSKSAMNAVSATLYGICPLSNEE